MPLRVAIIAPYGAASPNLRGPQRVAQELVKALLALAHHRYELFELAFPHPWLTRWLERSCLPASVAGLQRVHIVSPRACLDALVDQFDVVHFLGTLGFNTWPLLYGLHRRGIRTVATLNGLFRVERSLGYPYTLLDDWGEASSLRYANVLVAVSSGFQRLVEDTYPGTRNRILAIEHGVPQFAQYSASTGEQIFSAAGTDYVKGIPFLLEAVRCSQSSLQVMLAGRLGSQHALVMRQAAGLGHRFRYIGELPTEKLAALYRACRAYVQPSLYEPFGMAVLEAMAFGRPVVVTRQCGISSLIESGHNGYVVDHGDVDAMSHHLSSLSADVALAQRVGHNGLETARQYSWERAARRYESVYNALAERRS